MYFSTSLQLPLCWVIEKSYRYPHCYAMNNTAHRTWTHLIFNPFFSCSLSTWTSRICHNDVSLPSAKFSLYRATSNFATIYITCFSYIRKSGCGFNLLYAWVGTLTSPGSCSIDFGIYWKLQIACGRLYFVYQWPKICFYSMNKYCIFTTIRNKIIICFITFVSYVTDT